MNLSKVSQSLERKVKALVGGFNKDKALLGAFSGHYETSRRFVDSSNSFI